MAQRTTEDELARVWKEMEDLAMRVVALEHRVSRQEGEIKGLKGRTEELERR